MTEFVASPERLIIGALLGFAVLLFLIIKLKIQPFIAIMSSALIIGLVSGMPFSMITDTLAEGVGNTLQTIAILIGLGSMFGAILQVSGGVEVIADTLLKVFGEKKAPWALGITGLIVGMPVFFESGSPWHSELPARRINPYLIIPFPCWQVWRSDMLLCLPHRDRCW